MKTKTIITSLALFFWAFQAQAEIIFETHGFETSDHFDYSDFTVRYEQYRTDLWWPYAAEGDAGRGWLVQYRDQTLTGPAFHHELDSVELGYVYKFSKKFSLRGSGGSSSYASSDRAGVQPLNQGDKVTYSLQAQWLPSENNFLQLQVENQFLLSEVLIATQDITSLQAQSLRPLWIYNWGPAWRSTFRGAYSSMEDNNNRSMSDGQIMARPIVAHWFWFGVGATYTSYDQAATDYYSPGYVRSAGPRFEYGENFFKVWNLAVGGSYNWSQEDGRSSRGHYVSGRLGYGEREGTQIFLTFEDIQTERSGAKWDSSGLNIGVQSVF